MPRIVTLGTKSYEETELTCPDCLAPMHLTPFMDKVIYRCSKYNNGSGCRGSHGAHPGGKPLGIPAPWPTREARKVAHTVFDQIWREGRLTRRAAYRWLRGAMSLTEEAGHISSFDEKQCERLIHYVEEDFGIRAPDDVGAGVTDFVELGL